MAYSAPKRELKVQDHCSCHEAVRMHLTLAVENHSHLFRGVKSVFRKREEDAMAESRVVQSSEEMQPGPAAYKFPPSKPNSSLVN